MAERLPRENPAAPPAALAAKRAKPLRAPALSAVAADLPSGPRR